jgi:hypothetical protein
MVDPILVERAGRNLESNLGAGGRLRHPNIVRLRADLRP